MKKFNLFKMLAVLIVLITSINTAWADGNKGFFSEGQWKIGYNTGGQSDTWENSYHDNASTLALGVQTTLVLKGSNVKTWTSGDWTTSRVDWYYDWTSKGTTNSQEDDNDYNNVTGDKEWYFPANYNLISNAPNNPGNNTLYMFWQMDSWSERQSGVSTITFTIPGFETTSTSQAFDNTTVGNNSSETISFDQHYGTELETTDCAITGTNASDFSVTGISETGVTVQFAPASAGDKTATLTITDAHSKTCTISLSGTGIAASEPTITNLAVTAADVYSGEGSLTLTATRNAAAAGINIQYQVKVPGGSWTNIGDAVNSTTKSYSPTSGDGTYQFRAYPTGYSSNYSDVSKRVYEHWNIYVRDDVDNWGTMYLHLYNNSDGTSKSTWPGDACTNITDTKWYTVTLDSKWSHFILNNNNSGKQLLGGGSIATDKATYAPGSYWKTVWNSDGTGGDSGKKFYTLTSATVSTPEVEITSCNVYSTFVLLEGHVTDNGGDGSALSDLKEYGFYLGANKYSGGDYVKSTSGTYFRVKISSLTAGMEYAIKAFATNVLYTGYSSTQNKTTSDASRTIGIRYPNTTSQTLNIYAFRDISSDYGTETKMNASWSGVTLTRRAGTTRWWETTIENAADYQYFIVSNNGNKQTNNIGMPNADACWWYNDSPDDDHKADRSGSMDCPYTTPQLYMNATAGGTDYAYNAMSTSPSISKTMENLTAGTYTFKIMYTAEWYGKNSGNTISRTGATSSNAISSMAIDEGYITLNADFDGDYTFTFDPSTNTVSVTYPEAYTVTYSAIRIGNGTAWATDPTAAYTTGGASITSTHYVPVETDVTFTAYDANDDYTWKGWYDGPTLSDHKLSTDDDLTYALEDIDENTTIYAIYQEDIHTVTVTAGAHGSITTPTPPATTSAGIATSATIVANPADGYRFINWTKASGTGTPIFASAESKSTTVTVTGGDVTIQANFASNWVIGGSAAPFTTTTPWDMAHALSFGNFDTDGSGDVVGYVDVELPANTEYEVKVYDHKSGLAEGVWWGYTTDSKKTVDYTHNKGTALGFGEGGSYQNLKIVTAGHGTYRFTWNATDQELTVTMPASYTVTYDSKTFYNDDTTSDDTETGGSISTVKDNDNNDFDSGDYIIGTGSVTVTTSPSTGYSVVWYSDDTYTTPYVNGEDDVTISGEGGSVLTKDLSDDTGIYVKFSENMTTVALAATNGKIQYWDGDSWEDAPSSESVGVHTTCSIKAVPNWGYYFAGWEKTAGADYSISVAVDNEDVNETTLSGLGGGETSGQTLTAKFVELDKVYLYNMGWGESLERLWPIDGDNHIYAYFAVQEESSSPKSANTDDPYYIQQMATEDIVTMYAYVPRAVTRNLNAGTYGDNERIAFSNHQFTKNYKFYEYEAIYWGCYRQILNEFIPQVNDYKELNKTKVYNGYWKKHDPKIGDEAGYYLKHRTGTNTYGDFTNGTDPVFKYISDNMIQCKLRIDNSDDANNYYMIHSAGGVKYTTAEWPQDATAPDITSANCLNVGVMENSLNDSRFLIKQTSQGYYTLTMTFSSDTMYLKVDYPVAVGDYRLEHSYTVDAVTKKTYSGILKHDDSDKADFTSMYLNMDAGTKSLKMQTCTSIDGTGHPVWSTGVDVTGFNTANFKDGKGVYRFRISWVGNAAGSDVTSATPDIIALYDGEYYVKTDYALGGWTNWHMNTMEMNTINFNKSNPKTFDYYYTAWVNEEAGDRNVKCVIANIYNEALCDTLVGDDILGLDGVKPREFLDYDANVRFSYNSYTNELKRAYINGSNDGTTDYIYLQGSTGDNKRILNINGGDLTGDKVKFNDRGNWIYEIDIQAEEGARVKLISDYYHSGAHHYQFMKGSEDDWADGTTEQILGGSNNTTAHPIRVVYDFKTNHLISAWLAGGEETEPARAINTNAMILREHQEQARQITFANSSYKLTDVDTLYSVMHFNKWTLNNKSKESGHAAIDPAKSAHERDLYWISFPYDVKLSDVFGFGKYMQHWGIMYYDGRNRAKNGYWAEDETNWKFIPSSKKDTILHAFEGYVLALDLDLLGESSKVFELVEDIYLYFPSNGSAGSIGQQDTTVTIDTVGYHCTINRTVNKDGSSTGLPASYDRRYRDSHWHCIGVPSFKDVSHGIVQNGGEDPQPWIDVDGDKTMDMPNPSKYTLGEWETLNVPYFYEWNMEDNQLYAKSNEASYTFKSMYAYLVQYAKPSITWSAVTIAPKPKSVVERRQARLADDHFAEFNLNLMRDEQSLDHTYVRLTDNEGATAEFEFGQDMCKEFKTGANIYTLIDELEVAGNSLPLSEQTTIVPVGVKIAANGLYTFSMPEGTEGIGVVLVDNIAGTRTNLGLTDYEVSLTAGKIDNRFWLEISPISQVVTGIDQSGASIKDNIRKVVVDGIMYIVRKGEVFDARGNRVK